MGMCQAEIFKARGVRSLRPRAIAGRPPIEQQVRSAFDGAGLELVNKH